MEPISTTDSAGPWWSRLFSSTLAKPGGIAIIFSLALLGMMLGILPSTLSQKIDGVATDVKTILDQHHAMKAQIDLAVAQATANGDGQTKLLRGICIIIAQGQNVAADTKQSNLLNYCNP